MKARKDSVGLLGRREMILRTAGVLTFAGMGRGVITKAIAQTSTPIVLTPQETEGPYWVDEQLNHSDLATDPTDNSIQVGLPLVLAVTVSQHANGSITPLPGAYVDLWHCNAYGIYSDEPAYNPGGGTGTVVTTGKKFLRGYQVTDAHGSARFTSIYPGWYTSRTPHIHARVRLYSGSTVTENFTTQFFFDDSITDMVYQMSPYNTRPNRDTLNSTDNVYNGTDCNTSKAVGTETSLRLAADSSHAVASYNIILDLASPIVVVLRETPQKGILREAALHPEVHLRVDLLRPEDQGFFRCLCKPRFSEFRLHRRWSVPQHLN